MPPLPIAPDDGPMPPMFGMGGPPGASAPVPDPGAMMGGVPGGPPPMAGAGMGGAGMFPSTNPALVAQLLGPLLAAQEADDQRLQQEQVQSVLTVLASMKQSDTTSADAATAPAPIPENATDMPPQGGGGY